jgi:15-hydroxyprostaglandin dehydrogenase (NAD)
MSPPVAVITGASSGIGLAVTQHLLALQWHVVMADINPPKESLPNTTFIRTDIASWEAQAHIFSTTYNKLGRLDFAALNAGIDDRDDIFASLSEDTPRQPNLATFDINLKGTYYGVKLASHYMSLDSTAVGKVKKGGKIVITASAAGIYALPVVPQYTASKYALIGLVRSLGPVAQAVDITVNAVCPALVATGLAPAGLMDNFSEAQITPMSTIMRCFDEFAQFKHVGKEDWTSKGRSGDVIEGNLQELIEHKAPTRPEDKNGGDYDDEKGLKAWAKAYTERNRNFAMQGRMSEANGTR